jgi:hypothetical protein
MEKLDPRMIQAIIGLGADLSAYGANTDKGMQFDSLNAVTTKNIQAQNMLGLIKQALGPDNLNIKANNKGLTINVPNDLPEQLAGPGVEENQAARGAQAQAQAQPAAAPSRRPNPFANITNADLAGLTTQDIMGVLAASQAQDQISQQSYRDLVDAIYKGNQNRRAESEEGRKAESHEPDMAYKRALTAEATARATENTPSIEVDLGDGAKTKLTPKDYLAYQKLNKEDKTVAMKNYEFAKGDGFTGSFMEFQDSAKTTHEKDYKAAVNDGYKGSFNKWMLDLRKAGATNIGLSGKIEEKRAFGAVERENEARDPGLVSKVTKNLSADERAWRASTRVDELVKSTGRSPDEIRSALQRDKVFAEMDRVIKSSFPAAKFVRGKGWIDTDGSIIQRDPYGK